MVLAVTATGCVSTAVCQPDAVSPVNVIVERSVPGPVHSVPVCTPTFCGPL